jgi:hypothetical protein
VASVTQDEKMVTRRRKASRSRGQRRDDASAPNVLVNDETVNELVAVAAAEELVQEAEAVVIHSFNNEVLDEEEGEDEDELLAEQISSKKYARNTIDSYAKKAEVLISYLKVS